MITSGNSSNRNEKYLDGAAKRTFDIVFSTVILCVTLLPLGIAMVLIKIASPGPLFFLQERVGYRGRSFKIFKLRTMRVNLDAKTSFSNVTLKNDPRLFLGSNLLRATKVDELPQLLNVLLGNMSIVGPRPTTEDDYDLMSDEQKTRASAKPGLTGLAQISGNTSLSWPERILYDLEYIGTASIAKDLNIIFRTVLLVVSGRISTHPTSDSEW